MLGNTITLPITKNGVDIIEKPEFRLILTVVFAEIRSVLVNSSRKKMPSVHIFISY